MRPASGPAPGRPAGPARRAGLGDLGRAPAGRPGSPAAWRRRWAWAGGRRRRCWRPPRERLAGQQHDGHAGPALTHGGHTARPSAPGHVQVGQHEAGAAVSPARRRSMKIWPAAHVHHEAGLFRGRRSGSCGLPPCLRSPTGAVRRRSGARGVRWFCCAPMSPSLPPAPAPTRTRVPASGRAVELQPTAHPLHPRVDDGQAEAGAFDAAAVVAAEERPRTAVAGLRPRCRSRCRAPRSPASRRRLGRPGAVVDDQRQAAPVGGIWRRCRGLPTICRRRRASIHTTGGRSAPRAAEAVVVAPGQHLGLPTRR